MAAYMAYRQKKWTSKAVDVQHKILKYLLREGSKTRFGKDHGFDEIQTYEDFKQQVPINDYEGLRPYIDQVVAGKKDILWKGQPIYFAKTSGTTSGVKYIPITRDSLPNHIDSARDALLSYVYEKGNSIFLDKKLIFLSGNPTLDRKNGIYIGRLSGIVNHHIPGYLRTNQMPSYATNCIEDWEEKLEKIIDETLTRPMSLISGIPPWVQMYFDRLRERTGKPIKDIFPDFSLFVHGGVNFEPYRTKLYDTIGKKVDTIETYPASEGFFAYQDKQSEEGLLLLLNSGIFFEFIPMDKYFDENPVRLSIEEVAIGKNYAIIIHSNAGLWGYSIGDTVKFISKSPYRIVVTGRIKHFISAFGEHVIGEEVEKSLRYAVSKHPEVAVMEFSVAPQVTPDEGLPHHEWLIAFENPPENPENFAKDIDTRLCALNSYYDDLISGNILRPLTITPLQRDAFQQYMKSIGKLGGQNKVPRLTNDRKIADEIIRWSL